MQTFVAFVRIVLVLVVATQAWAQEVSPALSRAVAEAHQQEQEKQPEILPPAQVDSKLLNKKVRVYCRDGRLFEGKLVDVTQHSLRVATAGGLEEIQLVQVQRVEPRPGKRRRTLLVLAVVGAAFLITTVVVNAAVDF